MLKGGDGKEFTCPRAFKKLFYPITAKLLVKQGLMSNPMTIISGRRNKD